MPGSRTAWRMTLKGSCPGSVQSSWAFRKVVHFFCSSLSPPTSFYGRGRSQGAAPRPSPLPLVARLSAPPPPPLHWLLNGQPRPRPRRRTLQTRATRDVRSLSKNSNSLAVSSKKK